MAVADADSSAAERAGREYNCETVQDYRELLNRVDIQVIHLCTPHYLHAGMAAEFLQAGKHVLTEKPMALDIPSARLMLEAEKNNPGQLGIVFQNRYNDASIRIKETVDSGILGPLQCMKGIVTWHRSEAYYTESQWRGKWSTEGGGVLINQAIHTLDLLQWFGGELSSVQGSVTTDALDGIIEVEDTAHACLNFSDNVRGLFYATNAYLVNSPVELELVFEKGSLHQRRDRLYLWKDGQETLLSEPYEGSINGKSYWGSGHQKLILDYYTHIREGRKFWLDGSEGIKVLQIIEGIYSSSGNKQRVPLS